MGFMTRARIVVAAVAACCGLCCATTAMAQLSVPANDLPAGATVLTPNTVVYGNNVNATAIGDGPAAPCETSTNYRAVWFKFTPASTQRYQISSCHSTIDTSITVYSAVGGTNAAFVAVPGGCNADQCGGGPGPGATGNGAGAVVSNLLLTGGQMYWIRLAGDSASGPYQIAVYDYVTTGACCNNIGGCSVTSAVSCPAVDGVYLFLGGGTTCTPSNPCVGACCNNTTTPFTCTITPPGTGVGACGLGVWQGFGTTCAVNPCPVGTCCTATGGCSITLQVACTGTSAWNGAVTVCGPDNSACSTAVGACCTSNTGACYFGPLPCGTGTVFAGFGSTCTPDSCALGACCSSGQACTQTVAANCTGSSLWLGAGVSCVPAPCTAACCDTTGFGLCVLAAAAGCPTGTVTMGVGTSCTPGICATGACCTGTGVCSVVSGQTCTGLSAYLGNGTTCSPNPCLALMGSCCSTTGVCSVTMPWGCVGANTFNGSGVGVSGFACSPTNQCYATLGTCCSTTGGCSVTTAAGCVGTSTFTAPGTNVTISGTTITCTATTYCNTGANSVIGACCSTTGTCSVSTAKACTGTSVFLGVGAGLTGTACNTVNPCFVNTVLGACCSGTGGCSITTRSGCVGGLGTGGSGTYQGEGVNVTFAATATCTSTTYCNVDVATRIVGACCTGTSCTVTTALGCLYPSNYLGNGNGLTFTTTAACNATNPCLPASGPTNTTLGACCSTTGVCTITLSGGCVAPSVWGGVNAGYQGTTVCTTNFCRTPESLGACCSFTSGTCTLTTQAGCRGNSVFAGVNNGVGTGTACATNYCSTAPNNVYGTCCAGATCTLTTAANCTGTSVFGGISAATCTPTNPCIATVGACCSATGGCTATTSAGCVFPSTWTSAGTGVTVAGTACSPTTWCNDGGAGSVVGACCSILGTCTVTTASGCATVSTNTFAGLGTATGTSCSSATACLDNSYIGACCRADGACGLVGSAAQCTASGGTSFTSAGTACAPLNPCVGACCTAAGACSLTVASACPGPSFQGLGTACAASVSYNTATGSNPIEDISISGSPMPNNGAVPPAPVAPFNGSFDDGRLDNVPLGFAFQYYGVVVDQCRVGTNGWIVLGVNSTATTNYGVDLSVPQAAYSGFVGPHMEDLSFTAVGTLRYQTKGTAPFRRFIVQWHVIPHFATTTPVSTFQVILYETSNAIEFRWGAIDTVPAAGKFAGIRDPSNTSGLNVTASIAANTSLMITPAGWLCSQPPGACCVVNVCTPLEAAACAAAGGEYKGIGTSCTPNPCTAGACCRSDNTCSQQTESVCATLNGFFRGVGTTCDVPVGSCSAPIICCLGAKCQVMFTAVCASSGGTLSAGTSCEPDNPCAGSCCSATGACTIQAPAACAASTQTFGGLNTTCATTPCITGTCCTGPTCSITTANGCSNPTSFSEGGTCTVNPCGGACCQGAVCTITVADPPSACPGYTVIIGSTCTPNPCTGACCNGATCTLTTVAACTTSTVTLGTTCTPNPCVGPCCSVTGACTLTVEAACTGVAGQTFGGLGQTCALVPCIIGSCCEGTTCIAKTAAGCAVNSGAYGGDGSNCFYNPGVAPSTPVALEDIRNTGTALTQTGGLAPLTAGNLEDGYRNGVPIGFSFRYFNVPVTTVGISTNGSINMTGAFTSATLYGAVLPNAAYNGVIGPFMDDLDAIPASAPNGLILYQTKGSAPFRRFIVQWSRVEDFAGAVEHDFQVILHESSDVIEFRYAAVGAGFTGIQNATGTIGMNFPGITAPSSLYIAPITAGPCAPFVYATGACCNGSSCSTAVQSACQVAGSIYNGNGVACTPTNPCIVGACCAADGTCTGNILPAACAQSNGFYQGDFLSCTPLPAACTPGGCCLAADNTCEARMAAACTGAGRFFLGAGNACGPACPAFGRCCVGPACVVGFEAECTNAAVNWRTGETCVDTTVACAYCAAGSNDCNTVDEAIVRFTLNTIDNPSPYTPTPVNCYTDFTSISTTLTRGDTFPVVVLNQFAFTGDQCRVWVDWNKNNIFEQGGEEEFILTTADNITFAGAVTVPATAPLGTTRVRARLMFTGTVTPCGNTTYGEVEDYTVNVANQLVGACCSINTMQCAVNLSPSACEAAVGVWQGLDTTCPGGLCVDGACCLANLTCVAATQISCPFMGGVFTSGMACTAVTCPTNVGACCSGGSCSITFQGPCLATSGNQWTAAATCSPANPCVGPCCSDVGTCTLTTAVNCPGGAANFGALGTTCTASLCVGACCQGPTCIITGTAAAACPGYTVTRGTTCTPNPCAGACCQGPVCTITDAMPGSCPGYTVVIGTSCTPSPCAGACCNGPTCTLTTVAGCTTSTVTIGTTCAPTNPCVGACCQGAACTLTDVASCVGYTVVLGTTCAPINPCVGACCQGATCTLSDQAGCVGFTVVLGTTCAPGQCVGACCVGSSCSVQSISDCQAALGTYYGGGSNCFYQPPVVGTHAMEDISTSAGATQLNLGDDTSSATIPIPFTFRFFGAVRPELLINSNGWLGFSVPPDPQPTAVQMRVAVAAGTSNLPPNDFIAAMWADLNQNAGQLISYEVRGTAPYRRFIAQWTNIATFVNTGSNTFQIILYESSDMVELRYGAFARTTFGVGLENLAGDVGVQIPATSVGQNSSFSIAPLTGPCATFPYATGACCNGSTCTSGTLAACQIAQQSYQGDATGCSPNSACISGPCCTAGTCSILSNFACVAGGGAVQAGTSCTPDPCVAATGACCVAGACSQQTQTACAGFFAGVSSACTPNICPVCCRGTTCSTTIYSAAACVGSGTAGAVYVVGATAACGGANHLQPCCYADFNKIGGRNVTDIFNFLTAWFSGSRLAKVGGDGDPAGPAPQVGDIFAFLTDWFAGGCP